MPSDREASRRLGLAAMLLLYRAAERVLEAGVGAIVEANFWRGRCEDDLSRLVAGASAVRLHCLASRELLLRRQLARAQGASERHAGHVAHTPAGPLLALLERPDELASAPWPDYDPPDLATPLLVVDTTDGYRPELPEIVAWLERRFGRGRDSRPGRGPDRAPLAVAEAAAEPVARQQDRTAGQEAPGAGLAAPPALDPLRVAGHDRGRDRGGV